MAAWPEFTSKLRVQLNTCNKGYQSVHCFLGQVWRECLLSRNARNTNFRPGIEHAIVGIGYKLLFTSFPVFFCFVFIVKFMIEHRENVVFPTQTLFGPDQNSYFDR